MTPCPASAAAPARPRLPTRGAVPAALPAAALLAAVLLTTVGCSGHRHRPATAAPSPAAPAAAEAAPRPPLPEPEPPAAAPEPAAPAPAEALPEVPLSVRVGLSSDLARVSLPCCSADWRLEGGGESLPLTVPIAVEPAAAIGGRAVYRLQVAALSDEGQASGLAAELARRHGLPADAHFDAEVGLYRVRLGRFADRESAETWRRRLESSGLAGAWVVTEGGELDHPALRVVRDGRAVEIPGRWLRVRSAAPEGGVAGLPWGERRYRGDLLLFLNPRGALNVIDELPLEDYLRGVVPAEMGPDQYPRIEALKAQAVAARTYTLRNLGGFREEGYDICATPRCQVYGGVGVEHPLSDHAVAETAGQVLLWHGELVDARYSATCGGHTEDVEVVFPHEHHPYLKGVPCPEGGVTVVEGAALEGTPMLDALAPTLGPLPAASPGAGGLGPLRRRLREQDGFFLEVLRPAAGGAEALRLRTPDGELRVMLPPQLATFRLRGDARFATDLALVPGDPLSLWWAGDRLLALVQEVDSDRVVYDHGHPRASWTRFRSDRELAARIEKRFPGLGFSGLTPLSRGVSGRVGAVRIDGRAGRSELVEGLAVRWTLDLPDTNFTVRRSRQGSAGGYLFTGTGWGHGVGMCQVGSYGMAGRGLGYRDILEHFYTGVELVRVHPRSPPWSEPSPLVPPLALDVAR